MESMEDFAQHKNNMDADGFTIIGQVFNNIEIENIIRVMEEANGLDPNVGKTNGLVAVRRFFKEVPEAVKLIFTKRFNAFIKEVFGDHYAVVKSIYFDKPQHSNWFVAYHQDLTIAVNKKAELNDYSNWTVKQNQFAVQPPLKILENNFTIRIHLDDTDENNGALKVIPGSHLKGICRPESTGWQVEKEIYCKVEKGAIMIMRPLLLHASNKTTNHHQRRVIHIEFSNAKLPVEIDWAERIR